MMLVSRRSIDRLGVCGWGGAGERAREGRLESFMNASGTVIAGPAEDA